MPRSSHPSLRVLLVDDDARVRKTLSRVLTRRGWSVAEADSVASARDALATARYDVVVTDLGLGDGTGVEVMACARRTDATTPVIVLSGSLEPLDLRSGVPTSRLNKPISSLELIEAVTSAASSRRRRRTSAAVLYAALEAVDSSIEEQLIRLTEALETLAGAPPARAVEAA